MFEKLYNMKGGVKLKSLNNKVTNTPESLTPEEKTILSEIINVKEHLTKDDKIREWLRNIHHKKEYKNIAGGIEGIKLILNNENALALVNQTQQTAEQPGSSSEQSSSSSNTTVAELLKQMEDFRDKEMDPLVNATTEASKINVLLS